VVLITFLHLHQGIEQSRYRRVDAPMGGRETKIDAALFFTSSDVSPSWHDVAVVIECKLQKQKRQSISRSQLKRAAELVFSNQFRLFVWGISVFSHEDKDNQMKFKYKLHLYTRSGVIYSKEHDLDTEFQQFCDLLVGFSNMTPTQHGWYLVPRPARAFELPTMTPALGTNVEDLPPLHLPTYTTETLHLAHVLSVRSGLDNRATLVVLALTTKRESRVIKLTWLSQYRAERYERVVQCIKRTPIPGIPNLLYAGIFSQSDKSTDQYSINVLVSLVAGSSADALLNEDDFPNRQLFCVITDRPGVTIAQELSLERVFSTCAEVVEREHF
jgi:Fungal protein kinase